MGQLEGRVACVTGGTRGIGGAVVETPDEALDATMPY
jgi:hypothetical protein